MKSTFSLEVATVFVVVEALDMRLGIEGLSQRIQNSLGKTPCDGSVYIFSNRARTRLKILVWDGTGVWLCMRRLHRGCFVWPRGDETLFEMNVQQWQWLVAGVDWLRLSALPPAHWRV